MHTTLRFPGGVAVVAVRLTILGAWLWGHVVRRNPLKQLTGQIVGCLCHLFRTFVPRYRLVSAMPGVAVAPPRINAVALAIPVSALGEEQLGPLGAEQLRKLGRLLQQEAHIDICELNAKSPPLVPVR